MQISNVGTQTRSAVIGATVKLTVILLLIVSSCHFGFSQTPTTPEGYLEAGNRLVQLGFLKEAIDYYTEAIELKPDLADAYNNRAVLYVRQANVKITPWGNDRENDQRRVELFNLAIADHDKAIQLKPQIASFYKNRAATYSYINLERALVDLTAAIKIDPTDATTWNDRGRIFNVGSIPRVDKSIPDFTEAIRLKPDYVQPYKNRGFAYRRAQKFDLAIADYTKAIQLTPSDAESYQLRGEIYNSKAQYELAIADLSMAIQLKPERTSYLARALAYCKVNKKTLALADEQKAVELGATIFEKCK